MYLWAKAICQEQEEVERILEAFFEENNEKGGIEIKDDEVELGKSFDEPPLKLIKAICSSSEKRHIKCGEILRMENKDEALEETEQWENQSTEQNVAKSDGLKLSRKEASRKAKENIHIPELEEIAEKADSFGNFADLVAEWLKLEDQKEFFVNLVMASTEDGVSWKTLNKSLQKRGISYNEKGKIWISRCVSEKLNSYSVKLIGLLKIMKQYREYPFKETKPEKPVELSNETDEQSYQEGKEPEQKEEFNPKMKCMQEIPEFNEMLDTIDKKEPIESKIRYVLKIMGLEQNQDSEEEQRKILAVVKVALSNGKIDFNDICQEANLSSKEYTFTRMKMSTLVNQYVQAHGGKNKVDLMTFLSELKEVLRNQEE